MTKTNITIQPSEELSVKHSHAAVHSIRYVSGYSHYPMKILNGQTRQAKKLFMLQFTLSIDKHFTQSLYRLTSAIILSRFMN